MATQAPPDAPTRAARPSTNPFDSGPRMAGAKVAPAAFNLSTAVLGFLVIVATVWIFDYRSVSPTLIPVTIWISIIAALTMRWLHAAYTEAINCEMIRLDKDRLALKTWEEVFIVEQGSSEDGDRARRTHGGS